MKAKLYFNQPAFEHEVIKKEELHPELRRKVDEILGHVKASRIGMLNYLVLFINPLTNNSITSLHFPISFFSMLETKKTMEENGQEYETIPAFNNVITCYLNPKMKTLALSKEIDKITENHESPFARSDAKELLNKYNYGVVDNEGNLVLLKHPLDESSNLHGWKLLKKIAAWKQPFQRPRFEINKPRIKQKEKTPAFSGKLALAGVKL